MVYFDKLDNSRIFWYWSQFTTNILCRIYVNTNLSWWVRLISFKVSIISYTLGDLQSARYLWRRLPEHAKSNEITDLWQIGKHLWNFNINSACISILGLISSISEQESTNLLSVGMLTDLLESIRYSQLILISKAYTKISISTFMNMLALYSDDVVVEKCNDLSWNIVNGYILPNPMKDKKVLDIDAISSK